MEHLLPYFGELFTKWYFDEVHFSGTSSHLSFGFHLFSHVYEMFTRWYFLWWSSFFWNFIYLLFSFDSLTFWGILFHYAILWCSSFYRNFMDRLFVVICSSPFEKCSPCVNLMKFIFLGTWRNMCFHLFSQFEECSPCVKFDDFHFMGTLMQHVLLFQLLVLLLVSNCHEGPILGSTQSEDCVLFCLQGPNPPCLKIQVLTFVWPVY
jgi:hypothetical protein